MKVLVNSLFVISLVIGMAANAEDSMAPTGADVEMVPVERQLVIYPDKLKVHVLENMRGHLKAIADIMDALSNGKYDLAANIADARLGMNSTGAAGCRMKDANGAMGMMNEASKLDHKMSMLMPDAMKQLGQNMHKSANEFATIARDVAKSGNDAAAVAALGNVVKQCVACHAAYRLN